MTFKVPFRSDAQIDRDGRDAAGGGVMHQHTGSSRTAPLCPCLMCYRERGGRLIDLECGPLPDDMNVDVPAMLDQIATLRADLAASQREVERCREMIVGLVAQSTTTEGGALDSWLSTSSADALRYLAEIGRVEIISEHGRRVVARWKP